jgi:hypothetical protein
VQRIAVIEVIGLADFTRARNKYELTLHEGQMGVGKGKTEGGHRRGHSNMAYWWGTHDEAKEDSRIRRRIADRRLEQQAAEESSTDAAEPAAR